MEITLTYKKLDKDDLSEEDQQLLTAAESARQNAYAPYSNFTVGCALQMENGQVVTGNNQENAAYPSGLCAERVALFHAGAENMGPVRTLLVLAKNAEDALASAFPCGGCRQVILEYAMKQDIPIRVLMLLENEQLIELEDAKSLLPFAFSANAL
ncbi:MAG: cytidine deaminase [Cytophagales bacterium]|nr:cytidine deaminase [Cytophagales bacterium]